MTNLGNKEIFAKNLTYYVNRSGKMQNEISETIGVATSTFNDWMKGKKYPRIDKIEMLANFFGILKSDLIEDRRGKDAEDDGLSESQRLLIQFAQLVPEDKAALALRVMKSILEDEK